MDEHDFAVNADTLVCYLLTRAIEAKAGAVFHMNKGDLQGVIALSAAAGEDVLLAAYVLGAEEPEEVGAIAASLWPDLGDLAQKGKGNSEISGEYVND